MSESMKPRFAVDLTDIERQLAQTGSHQVQPAAATRNDPLAELARIVGQEDPFQAILAADSAARPRQHASSASDLFATRDTMTPTSRPVQAQARQNGYDSPEFDEADYAPQAQAPRSNAQAYAYQQPAPAHQQEAYQQEAYADDYYDEGGDSYAGAGYGQPERLDYPPVQKRRSRKGLIAVGAVVGAVVVGGGGAYLLKRSPSGASGAPILVQAATDPVKVQPQNPGGVEIPNQNKQIYERAQQTTATKVVNREEQPVDVKQAMRANGGSAVADATGTTLPGAQARNAPNSLNLGEPRKVRTVTIRPDGTVVGAPEAAPAAKAAPAMTMPAAASAPAPQPAVQMASAQPSPAAATPMSAPAPKPAPAAATPVATPAAPAPQKVASAQPAPAAAPDTSAAGGYAVQLGLANSEDAAASAFTSFQRKYSDLEGLPSLIRKAEVNGNTIYRVRVGPMSREEASTLCSKVQGQGGQCFVAKN